LEYRVYIRYESSPGEARRNAEEGTSEKYGPVVLDAARSAEPGEETPILEEALDEVRINGKYVALYRGRPAGYDRRGGELFVPTGLAWCKDSEELALMLGVPLQRADRRGGEARAAARGVTSADSHAFAGRYDAVNHNSEVHHNSDYGPIRSNEQLYGDGPQVQEMDEDGQGRQGRQMDEDGHRRQVRQVDTGRESRNVGVPRDGRGAGRQRNTESKPPLGWLAWTGIFLGCFVGAFVIVYGIATLFGR